MAKQFNPRKILKHISNSILKLFFDVRGELQEIDWNSLKETQIEPIFEAWQKLPEAQRREVQQILQDVQELADERGLPVLAEEIQYRCPNKLDEFASIENRPDKVLWAYLNARDAFEQAALFARADALQGGNCWLEYQNLPRERVKFTAATENALATGLTNYYRNVQARGDFCKIERYERSNGAEYYFVYLSDYPDKRHVFDKGGECQLQQERGAFEVFFVHCSDEGTLDIFAKGGHKVIGELQKIFCANVLGTEDDFPEAVRATYDLDCLKNASFLFPTDPADGIAEVRIPQLKVEPIDAPGRAMILVANAKGNRNDIHQMIDNYLNLSSLPRQKLHVASAKIQLVFMSDGRSKPKSLTFNISRPNFCNLRSKPEPMQAIGKRCLKVWGITND